MGKCFDREEISDSIVLTVEIELLLLTIIHCCIHSFKGKWKNLSSTLKFNKTSIPLFKNIGKIF